MFGVPTEIWVGIGLMLLVHLLLMSFSSLTSTARQVAN